MKISPVRNNVTFGYNHKYHNRLKRQLQTKGKRDDTAKTLLYLENMATEIEDKLTSLENKKTDVNTPKYEMLADSLLSLKGNIAFYMEEYYPGLDYCVEGIDEYDRERRIHKSEAEYRWREEIYDTMVDIYSGKVLDEYDYMAEQIDPLPEVTKEDKTKETLKTSKDETKEKVAKPSNILTEFIPTTSSPKSLDDVIGMEETKEALQEDIIDYIENPELIEKDKEEYGIESCGTILFYGPPGCGKTYITEALAMQSGLKMYKMDVSKIGSKYVNQTAGNIQKAFDYLAQSAKEEGKPVLLFIDELDSLAIKRESSAGDSGENLKTTSTLLKLIQEAKDKNIIVVGATNRRNIIDSALLDRFGTEAYFGLPDKEAIEKLLIAKLGKITKGQNLAKSEEMIDKLASSLEGYSNRTIVHIIQEAAKIARRNSRSDITYKIFNKAIKNCEHEKINEKIYKKEETRTIGFA